MNRTEKDEMLQRLNEEQLALMSTMSQSDAHASKCIKMGLNFQNEYPEDYAKYSAARIKYNENEAEIARIEAIEVEEDTTEPREDFLSDEQESVANEQ